jgi:Ca-activated chloride channel family protein
MRVLWPWFLPLLLFVPVIVAAYIWILRRKRRAAVRYSSLALIREALPSRARWRRHIPFAVFLTALASLSLAVARPVAEVEVPISRTTIILAMDISRGMCATDVDPNRLTVAQEAALAFVEELAAGTQMGIVAFSDFAQVLVPPTRDKEALRLAIESLTTSIGTAIGSATLRSIDALADINLDLAQSAFDLSSLRNDLPEGYQPDIIVLLTDGANTRGPRPEYAAQQAADRRVRVFTIGIGATVPGPMVCAPEQIGSDAFGPGNFGFGGGGGGRWRLRRRWWRRFSPLPAAGRTHTPGRGRHDRRYLLPGRERRPAPTSLPGPAQRDHATEAGPGAELRFLGRGGGVCLTCGWVVDALESIAIVLTRRGPGTGDDLS